jgi:hypothetical protein
MSEKEAPSFQHKEFAWPQILGIVVIILLIVGSAWTLREVVPSFSRTFSSLGAALSAFTHIFIPAEQLSLTAEPPVALSGEAIKLSWTHVSKREEGTYSLSYPCQTGVYLGLKTESGDSTLLCDTESGIKSTDNTLDIVAYSERDGSLEFPISLSYTHPSGKPPISTSLSVILIGSGAKVERPKETKAPVKESNVTKPEAHTPGSRTEKTYTLGASSTPTAVIGGKPDLVPKILEVGVIDKTTNVFTATSSLFVGDRIAVRFEVENIGTADSGNWQFSAVLPTIPMHIFESEGQQSLAPGDRIEYTLGFDNVEPNVDGRFVVNVDPTSSVPEASDINNIASTTIHTSSR